MIRIFKPTDTVYTSNGEAVLKPLRAIVHKEDKGGMKWLVVVVLILLDMTVDI